MMTEMATGSAEHREIERKFRVSGDFRPDVSSSSHIMQGYLVRQAGRSVRVRLRDEKAYLTIKGPVDESGISRFEWEKEITPADARALMTLCIGGFIDKTRHLVPFGGHVFEVDEFHGDNEGLVVAEVELSAVDEDFARPAWLGTEVSGDVRYYNSHLLQLPYKFWKDEADAAGQ